MVLALMVASGILSAVVLVSVVAVSIVLLLPPVVAMAALALDDILQLLLAVDENSVEW